MKKALLDEYQKAIRHLNDPNLVSCCLKKRVVPDGPWSQFAVVVAPEVTRVFLRDVKTGDLTGASQKYASVLDLLNDGWEID